MRLFLHAGSRQFLQVAHLRFFRTCPWLPLHDAYMTCNRPVLCQASLHMHKCVATGRSQLIVGTATAMALPQHSCCFYDTAMALLRMISGAWYMDIYTCIRIHIHIYMLCTGTAVAAMAPWLRHCHSTPMTQWYCHAAPVWLTVLLTGLPASR